MAHLDTACGMAQPIRQIEDRGFLHTDGTSILGADDRAGVTVLLYMMANNVPGYYCLFVGEERGCVGSSAARKEEKRWEGIFRAISFDRCGYSSIITHQCGDRTASDAFAIALSIQLEDANIMMSPDDTGVFTDSQEFADLIPECTNISVGYANAHSTKEVQDLDFLDRLCEACLMVDWEGLPTVRDPAEYGRGWGSIYEDGYDGELYHSYNYKTSWRGSEEELEDSTPYHSSKWETTSDIYDPWDSMLKALEFGCPLDCWDIAACIREDPEQCAEIIERYAIKWGV